MHTAFGIWQAIIWTRVVRLFPVPVHLHIAYLADTETVNISSALRDSILGHAHGSNTFA